VWILRTSGYPWAFGGGDNAVLWPYRPHRGVAEACQYAINLSNKSLYLEKLARWQRVGEGDYLPSTWTLDDLDFLDFFGNRYTEGIEFESAVFLLTKQALYTLIFLVSSVSSVQARRIMTNVFEAEKTLNVTFFNKALLQRALTHRSYLNENPDYPLEDNERLEFLGDAVLDFITGEYLYHRFPEMPEGRLTNLRSALVRTETLAQLPRSLIWSYLFWAGGGRWWPQASKHFAMR
jgi:hypothetical protein